MERFGKQTSQSLESIVEEKPATTKAGEPSKRKKIARTQRPDAVFSSPKPNAPKDQMPRKEQEVAFGRGGGEHGKKGKALDELQVT